MVFEILEIFAGDSRVMELQPSCLGVGQGRGVESKDESFRDVNPDAPMIADKLSEGEEPSFGTGERGRSKDAIKRVCC